MNARNDRYIEKSLLWLVLLSVALHLLLYGILWRQSLHKVPAPQQPYEVDLTDIPPIPEKKQPAAESRRLSDVHRRVSRETAPRPTLPQPAQKVPAMPPPGGGRQPQQAPARPAPAQTQGTQAYPSSRPSAPTGSAEIFRPKAKGPAMARLYPSASTMASLEEKYRRKYRQEVEQGETAFLNTDDIVLGSFLKRFEDRVYGVWRYPEEAVRRGIEGVTPVRITFNRNGDIVDVELLESSGSRILDDEVKRTMRVIASVGPLPRSYPRDNFKLIAFFEYGIVRGGGSGLLR